jgi:dephospho-CoA kinase
MGFPVYDADTEAKKILLEAEASSKIKKLLGEKAYLPDVVRDRKYMADCIFSEPALRNAINEIIHPLVQETLSQLGCEKFRCFNCGERSSYHV